MAQCEMCSKTLPLVEAEVEGALMKVCSTCAKFGVVKKKPKPPVLRRPVGVRPKRQVQKEHSIEFVVPNAGQLIKAAREKLNMRQIDLSRRLSISESEIHQVESGHLRPTIALAEKFEDGLKLKLVAERSLDNVKEVHNSDDSVGGMTIADMIKKKK